MSWSCKLKKRGLGKVREGGGRREEREGDRVGRKKCRRGGEVGRKREGGERGR